MPTEAQKKPRVIKAAGGIIRRDENVREAAAKELSALACEVGRIQQRIARLEQLLKAA